jgi:HAD superfamily hydrolase (TIGR01509 family)
MPPQAVLFDFDGVLADTGNVHVAAWERTFGDMGWDVPADVCARAEEEDDRAFLTSLFAARQVENGDLNGWLQRKQALARMILADSPRLYPGVRDLVHALQGRTRLAVVSVTWRENAAIVLGTSGLADAFERIIGKEDTRKTKPHPEPYKHALEQMDLKPSAAVAIEDSPTGLSSARGAKIPVIAIGHRRPQGDWCRQSPFLPNFRDLDATLKALGFA